jgi:CRISPR type III-A-associated RAMP protein Csm4
MNPGLVVKLRPAGPWRIGPDSGARNRVDLIYHSDSLYSAVASAMAKLGSLDEWLSATARAAAPAVSFSSCFPFLDEIGFIVPPRTLWPPVSPGLKTARIRWKSARFVPIGIVQAILAGQTLDEHHWSVDGASQCLVPAGRPGPFRIDMRWNAAVDRLTGLTERHSTACLEFRPGAGLWTVVSFLDDAARDRWLDPVKAAFRLLADTGFGGERSRGWGRAESPEFLEGHLPDMILPPVAVAAPEPLPRVEVAPEAGQPEPASQPEAAIETARAEPMPQVEAGPEAVQPEPASQPEAAIETAQAEPLPQPEAAPEAVQPEPASHPEATPEAALPEPEPQAAVALEPAPQAEVVAPLEPRPSGSGPSEVEADTEASVIAPVDVAPLIVEPALPEVEAVAVAAEPVAATAPEGVHLHWLLSLFAPASTDAVDWTRGNYSLLTRGGRVESPSGSGELKKQVQMVAEGSVLYGGSAPTGAAPDVAPDGFAHPVFRAGFAVVIPLPGARS